jgi:hypothetical protein
VTAAAVENDAGVGAGVDEVEDEHATTSAQVPRPERSARRKDAELIR